MAYSAECEALLQAHSNSSFRDDEAWRSRSSGHHLPTTMKLQQPRPERQRAYLILKMANRGYDVVVDVDTEGDLGHTDLQDDDLEFHPSSMPALDILA